MNYPKFYDDVKTITLYDPLSEILGSFDDGIVKVKYIHVVKFAGHSCPTVAGAYLMSSKALAFLYKDKLPVRGNVKVEFKESVEEGVAGVIGNVISNITGATDIAGFKGLNGKFARHSLMFFNKDIPSSARFTRVDTGQAVDVFYDPSNVQGSPEMNPLMQRIMAGVASSDEKKEFGNLWQKRVKAILVDHFDDPNVIWVKEV